MNLVPIGDLVEPVSQRDPATLGRDWITYLDISTVDREDKQLTAPDRIRSDSAPTRARQILAADDLLVSTVRPNLNAVALVPPEYSGEVASTGFCVLRPRATQLLPSYLYFFARTHHFVSHLARVAVGASYPAVTDSDVLEIAIPVPSLHDQHRIALLLDQADRLRRARRDALTLSDSYLPARFVELFSSEADPWPQVTVEGLASDKLNAIRTGPFGSQLLHSEFRDDGIAVLGIDNAVNNRFEWAERRFITPEKFESLKRYTVYPGDVLITIMGTCGRCAVVPDDIETAINTKHLCCISVDRVRCLPNFLQGAFLYHPYVRGQLERATNGAIMDGLNMEIIKALAIPLPPLLAQQEYVTLALAHQRLLAGQREALRQSEHLFRSLLHRTFDAQLL